MIEAIFNTTLQYAGYCLELGLVVFILRRRQSGRLLDLCLYLIALLVIDGVGRPFVLQRYGFDSGEYKYFYWLSDVVLTLGAFLLVCSFFHRGFSRTRAWHYLKLILPIVLFLVIGISWYAILHHYTNLFGGFIIELQRNLYFACLVLTTTLYVMMQGVEVLDDDFHLLVCGLGLQFAGPAANMAAMLVSHGQSVAGAALGYVSPLCTLAMLSVWLYAVARAPRTVASAMLRTVAA